MVERRTHNIIKAYTLTNYTSGTWICRGKQAGHNRSLKKKFQSSVRQMLSGPFWLNGGVHLTLWHHFTWMLAVVRPISGQFRPNFEINIFAFHAHFNDSEFPQNSKYALTSLLQCLELPETSTKKMAPYLFVMKCYKKTPKMGIFLKFGMCIVPTYYRFQLRGDMFFGDIP